jgi:hypothetical protein
VTAYACRGCGTPWRYTFPPDAFSDCHVCGEWIIDVDDDGTFRVDSARVTEADDDD